MKICIVTPEFPGKTATFGGIGTYQKHLAETLRTMGHQIHILIIGGRNNSDKLEDGIFYHQRILKISKYLQLDFFQRNIPVSILIGQWISNFELKQLDTKYKFDLIQATNYQSLIFLYLHRKLRPPVVNWVNTFNSTIDKSNHGNLGVKHRFAAWLESYSIRHSDYLVTATNHHRQTMVKAFSLSSEKIQVISLGLKMSFSLENDRTPLLDPVKILYVGRLENRKGVDILLKAIPDVLEKNRRALFILAGRDYKNRFENEFLKNSPEWTSRVCFKGEVSQRDLDLLYQNCDIFVSPSRYESFGLTFVEAMSYGKPVVGCRAGAVPEVVEDGLSGFLVEPENHKELAKSLLKLVAEPALRKKWVYIIKVFLKKNSREK